MIQFHSYILAIWVILASGLTLFLCLLVKLLVLARMSTVADVILNGGLATAVDHLLSLPETLGKIIPSSHAEEKSETRRVSSPPVDILETTKEYTFFFDVPGLSKSEIQVSSILLSSLPCPLKKR